MLINASMLVAVEAMRSRYRSPSSRSSALGALNERSTETGMPAWLPGV